MKFSLNTINIIGTVVVLLVLSSFGIGLGHVITMEWVTRNTPKCECTQENLTFWEEGSE